MQDRVISRLVERNCAAHQLLACIRKTRTLQIGPAGADTEGGGRAAAPPGSAEGGLVVARLADRPSGGGLGMGRVLRADQFMDPTGQRYGIPTWPWRMAPPHLATLRQLAARGLRPGGQHVQAQVLWRSRRARSTGRVRAAYLYDVRLALPKRVATDAQRGALAKALAAQRLPALPGRPRFRRAGAGLTA
jgi:hypothetical protein